MRFRSSKKDGFQVFAVSGINTISFGIVADAKARKGLLGFAVERHDPTEDQRFFMYGFKVFKSVITNPKPHQIVSTKDHPVQSFVWDDFTGKPDREYQYWFYPLRGTPKKLDRSAEPISIKVATEPLFTDGAHDVFFNRGVASSQAYEREFGNRKPDNMTDPDERQRALDWLSRDLDEAVLRFIHNAEKGDSILGCFYEFRYQPVAAALKDASDRGVDVRLIVDGKKNKDSFPRAENLKMLKTVKFPMKRVTLREARTANIQHNKFMVLLKGGSKPTEVWTGSTNMSVGGITGQTNVGHWVRDKSVATQFRDYWKLLSEDPGGMDGDDASTVRRKNAELRNEVGDISPAPEVMSDIEKGVTAVFSPRSGQDVLDLWAAMVDSADKCACITLAFGINDVFKDVLADNTSDNHIVFMLLEKEDKPKANSKKAFVEINAANNVYKAWGAFIQDPVYQWAKETNAKKLQLNQHVSYVHSKFLLVDPLGNDPIVVTGSANFSKPSVTDNDENMLFIRGDTRVADIYFTEFNRLFNHYYFRAVHEATHKAGRADDEGSLFLAETPGKWLAKYADGKLKAKRLNLFAEMKKAVKVT
jgi:phosphatidylserine/phosphatidylglycerophosphate/cardiolipin synthase-like enzyme